MLLHRLGKAISRGYIGYCCSHIWGTVISEILYCPHAFPLAKEPEEITHWHKKKLPVWAALSVFI